MREGDIQSDLHKQMDEVEGSDTAKANEMEGDGNEGRLHKFSPRLQIFNHGESL